MPFNAILTAFVLDTKTLVLVVLVLADLISGVLGAVRTRTFAWERVGDWLVHDVAYLIGYAVWYVLTQAAVGGAIQGVDLGDALGVVGWGTATTALVASVVTNLQQAQRGVVQA